MHRSWNRFSRWADRRLPGFPLLAFLVLMSQFDSARATDIELAVTSAEEGLSPAVLGFVYAAPLPALVALLYGLRRARRGLRRVRKSSAACAGRPVNFPASDRQEPGNTLEHRTMRLGDFLAAALLLGGIAYHSQSTGPACSHGPACRTEAPAALALFGQVGERFLALLPR